MYADAIAGNKIETEAKKTLLNTQNKIVLLDDVGILRSLSYYKIVVKIDGLLFSCIFTQRPHKNEVIGQNMHVVNDKVYCVRVM